MLLSGVWHRCDDSIVRPLLRGKVRVADDTWILVPFLIDSGADRTVFSADVLKALGLEPIAVPERLGGAGGAVDSVVVETKIQFPREDGVPVGFQGQYAAALHPDALDMSVLGRDVTNLFALILDRPNGVVCLVGPPHRYSITAG